VVRQLSVRHRRIVFEIKSDANSNSAVGGFGGYIPSWDIFYPGSSDPWGRYADARTVEFKRLGRFVKSVVNKYE
jgi:hypothetical protein